MKSFAAGSPDQGILRGLAELVWLYRRGEVSAGLCEGNERVAVVLGAQVLRGGRASRTLEARVLHAADLYALGDLDLIIPTGGLGEHGPTESEVMARILRDAGVPDEAMLLEDRAVSTWESAINVGDICRERGIEGVRIISDPLHCVRAVGVFRWVGLRSSASPAWDNPMWHVAAMRRGQLAREMGAMVWYRVKHGVGSRYRR